MPRAGFGEIAEKVRRCTVEIRTPGRQGGYGSGVVWNSDGAIVTNAHVVAGSAPTVVFWDGTRLPARVSRRDERRDLALLACSGREVTAATIGDSLTLRPGELVLAVGNPYGFQGALSTGVVHAVGPLEALGPQPWVQAALRLAPGNSGGPLANARGEVVGINTMIAGGLGLAVPSATVRTFLAQPAARGNELGVVLAETEGGLLILEIAPDSPAERASLLIGDRLTAVNNRALTQAAVLAGSIERGGLLELRFRRGANPAERTVVVPLGSERFVAA